MSQIDLNYQVLPLRVRVDLGAMTIKECSHIPQSSSITRTLPSDFVSYPGHSSGGSYPSAEKQSLYFIPPPQHHQPTGQISFWTEKYSGTIPSRFNRIFLPESIEFNQNNNSFQFDNRNYSQTPRTAIKTRMAPKIRHSYYSILRGKS